MILAAHSDLEIVGEAGDGHEAVEQAALDILKSRKPNRSLQTNVEFYTALLLEALAFPPSGSVTMVPAVR